MCRLIVHVQADNADARVMVCFLLIVHVQADSADARVMVYFLHVQADSARAG